MRIKRSPVAMFVLLLFALLAQISPVLAQKEDGWQDPESLLLSDPPTRAKAIKKLKLGPGVWTVAVMTMTPGSDSERLLTILNDRPRTLILIAAPEQVVRKWREQKQISARVVSVAAQLTYDLGIFHLPTLLRVENGRITGARENLNRSSNMMKTRPS